MFKRKQKKQIKHEDMTWGYILRPIVVGLAAKWVFLIAITWLMRRAIEKGEKR